MKRMKITSQVKIVALVLLLSVQGCYLGYDAAVYDNCGGAAYAPPPLVFQTPPDVIVLPDTDYVYVVPDIAVDLFFWDGWWWRPWGGRWYRSPYYDRDWACYGDIPSFYWDIDPGWRGYYRGHNWRGHRWNYEHIPNQSLQRNWKAWNDERHWERQKNWGVDNYQPRPPEERQDLRRQRQQQYQPGPEIQRPPQRPQQDRQYRDNQPGYQRRDEDSKPQRYEPPLQQQHEPRPELQHQPRRQEQENEGQLERHSQPQRKYDGREDERR